MGFRIMGQQLTFIIVGPVGLLEGIVEVIQVIHGRSGIIALRVPGEKFFKRCNRFLVIK
jgi:hypothetical protein